MKELKIYLIGNYDELDEMKADVYAMCNGFYGRESNIGYYDGFIQVVEFSRINSYVVIKIADAYCSAFIEYLKGHDLVEDINLYIFSIGEVAYILDTHRWRSNVTKNEVYKLREMLSDMIGEYFGMR